MVATTLDCTDARGLSVVHFAMLPNIDNIAFVIIIRRWRKSVVTGWGALSLSLFALILLPVIDTNGVAEGHTSYYVRSNRDQGVIIFVHGVLGDAVSTWTNADTKAYWPNLLSRDRTFDNYNIYVYAFPSTVFGKSYSIDELADNMRLVFQQADIFAHDKLIFLSHSMGGVATRALLLKYRDLIPKVRFLYFFSSPTTGSELASVAGLVSKNSQFSNMFPMGDNSYIESLQSSWLAAKFQLRSFCAYEKLDTYGIEVVTRQSATNLCTEPLVPILENHISIVKPADRTKVPYLAFKDAFVDVQGRPPH